MNLIHAGAPWSFSHSIHDHTTRVGTLETYMLGTQCLSYTLLLLKSFELLLEVKHTKSKSHWHSKHVTFSIESSHMFMFSVPTY